MSTLLVLTAEERVL